MSRSKILQKLPPDILWWGRSDNDYSRNRVLRQCLISLGFKVTDFSPRFSSLGSLEASVRGIEKPSLIWVPCFRQRDMAAAARWGRKKRIPVVFDPLISAFDKQVFEREKFPPESSKAGELLQWEKGLFQSADLVIADTHEHAKFYKEVLGAEESRVAVVPVGAEEGLFKKKIQPRSSTETVTVLFYGSFLKLQGPEVIIEAARLLKGPKIAWKFVGHGPLTQECKQLAAGMANIEFISRVPYQDLPDLICSADILLGIFGSTAKAGRVIPNKVYQALACGKPLVTMMSPAYPEDFTTNHNLGIRWVEPGNPQQLADSIAELVEKPEILPDMGAQAYQTFKTHFSMAAVSTSLTSALSLVLPAFQKRLC